MNINEQALAAVAFVNSRFTGESPERERRSVGGLRNCEREEISHHLFSHGIHRKRGHWVLRI